MVADDEVLLAAQAFEDGTQATRMHFVCEITDDVDSVGWSNDGIPELDECAIVLFNRGPRPIAETQNILVPEMRVRSEKCPSHSNLLFRQPAGKLGKAHTKSVDIDVVPAFMTTAKTQHSEDPIARRPDRVTDFMQVRRAHSDRSGERRH